MKQRARFLTAAAACALAACTPTLDWRTVRPQGSGLEALFPCKPAAHARNVALAGVSVEMTLYACAAGGATYAVGFAEIGQPQSVERALGELSASAARNIGAVAPSAQLPLRVVGMTPNPRAGRQILVGQLGDGLRVVEQVAVFARGTRVFQATMVGARLDAEAVEAFFGALRLPT